MSASMSTATIDTERSGPRPVAVIDIGASSIRMAIAEIKPGGDVRILERLVQGVSLGKDTFTTGTISRSTIEACVKVLRDYQKKLAEYDITRAEQIRVVATSAVREASNRLSFLDRVYIATGLSVQAIDEAEVARITYLGIQPLLQREPALAASTTMIVEVGGGSTEVLVLRSGDVIHSHTYRLGSLRLRETMEAYHAPRSKSRQIMESQIGRTIEQVRRNLGDEQDVRLLALGGDVRFAASQLSAERSPDRVTALPVDELERFTDEILKLSVDRIVQRYHLSLPDAQSVGPALLTFVGMARELQLDRVLITDFTLRDALLNQLASESLWSEEFMRQIVNSSLATGRRFGIDEAHAKHVADLSVQLYRELAAEHRLPPRSEMILRVAALLHEVGTFVNARAYHKHSQYLISHSEIFGLGPRDLRMVALVARYHRRASPKLTHDVYASLGRDERIAVCKLAALLRVADSLDHSRSQRVRDLTCAVENGQLVISVSDVDDLSLEQMELQQKGGLFEETYGLQVLLRRIEQSPAT